MAGSMHISHLNCNFWKIVPPKAKHVSVVFKLVQSVRCTTTISNTLPIVRRSGNYQPCIWDNNFLQSLRTKYTPESLTGRADKLKGDVVKMFNNAVKLVDQLELINHLQRLGLAYLFDEEIERTLKKIYSDHSNNKWELKEDLYSTALEFRLLRQHGYHIPEVVFKSFTDNGNFRECLREDVKGMLSLYEASYCSFEGECLMEEGWCFTSKNLKELHGNIIDPNLAMHVKHALELQLHWRMPWLEARWYIDVYETSNDIIPVLLQLAKLNFNLVQGFNQEELKHLSGWDINEINQPPDYMKICFLALYKFVNEIAYDILEEQNINVLPHLKKAWLDLLKADLVEARWYASGHKPTLEEYLSDAWVSISAPLDELKRGDVPKSIQCYMFDTGASEDVAREHMRDLLRKTWKEANKLSQDSDILLSKSYIEIMINLSKTVHCFYSCGDGFGVEDGVTKDKIYSLLIQPIPM